MRDKLFKKTKFIDSGYSKIYNKHFPFSCTIEFRVLNAFSFLQKAQELTSKVSENYQFV